MCGLMLTLSMSTTLLSGIGSMDNLPASNHTVVEFKIFNLLLLLNSDLAVCVCDDIQLHHMLLF